jgi:hypothetical protein
MPPTEPLAATPKPTATPTPLPTPANSFHLDSTLFGWEGRTGRDAGVVTIESGPQVGRQARTERGGRYRFGGTLARQDSCTRAQIHFVGQTKDVTIAGDATLDFTLDSP